MVIFFYLYISKVCAYQLQVLHLFWHLITSKRSVVRPIIDNHKPIQLLRTVVMRYRSDRCVRLLLCRYVGPMPSHIDQWPGPRFRRYWFIDFLVEHPIATGILRESAGVGWIRGGPVWCQDFERQILRDGTVRLIGLVGTVRLIGRGV